MGRDPEMLRVQGEGRLLSAEHLTRISGNPDSLPNKLVLRSLMGDAIRTPTWMGTSPRRLGQPDAQALCSLGTSRAELSHKIKTPELKEQPGWVPAEKSPSPLRL